MLLIGAAVLTVVLSWAVINTVFTLRDADQHFRSKPGGITFGAEDGLQRPSQPHRSRRRYADSLAARIAGFMRSDSEVRAW